MKVIAAIGTGGAIGTSMRYGLSLILPFSSFPIGTLLANLVGSLLLGILTGYFSIKHTAEWVKAGLGVGLCGGFTTFSTFALETVSLFHTSLFFMVCYIFLTLCGGFLSAMAGVDLGERIGGKKI